MTKKCGLLCRPDALGMQPIGGFIHERFAPYLPADQHRHHAVVISGGGPIGLATALGLAKLGVASVVIEADDSVCEGSRAICVSRRSLHILQRLGVLGAFLAKGLPWTSGRSCYRGQEVLRFTMPHADTDKLPPMVNIAQYHIEQFLLDEVRKFPDLIDIRWASSVTDVQHSPSQCTVQVGNALGSYSISCDWLVAADGGQSFVRKSLGLKLQGQAFTGKFVIVDIELASDFPTERRAWFDCSSNPGSTMLMHKQPDNIWRIDYQIADDADLDAAIQVHNVRPVVQRHLDMLGEAHLPWRYVWSSAYRAGTMTLDSYVHGRVVFAGNAAHALPIFGVRGLNSGIDDADNLAWKLAAIVKGQASARLLQSYSDERIAAYQVNADNAGKSTEFMAPGSRGFALMREAALSLSLQHAGIAQLVNPRQTSAVAYADRLGLGDPLADGLAVGAAPMDVPLGAANLPKHTQAYLLDGLQTAFALLVFGEVQGDSLPEVAQLLPALQIRSFCPADDGQGLLQKAWGWHRAVLLRPDGHVLARYAAVSAQRIAHDMQTVLQGEPDVD